MQPENNQNKIDTSQIKIPDTTMLLSVEKFAMGKNRAQIAEELLDNLPEELKILADMDRQQAKSLLCSRLRQADPNSTKFAYKYTKHYREALEAAKEALNATMRHAIAARVQSFEKTGDVLNKVSDKLREHLETITPENIGSPETLNCIKTFLSVCKTQNQNMKEMATFVASFTESQEAYEKKYNRY